MILHNLTRFNIEILPAPVERLPYHPSTSEWRDVWDMLCGHCIHAASCAIVEGMIAMKDGADWPQGGWVTDPGAGVTCLSYKPAPRRKLPRQQLRALDRQPEASLPPVCGGCAARPETEASTSLHTRRDFQASVRNESLFTCHEDPAKARPCGGWCRAVRARRKGSCS